MELVEKDIWILCYVDNSLQMMTLFFHLPVTILEKI